MIKEFNKPKSSNWLVQSEVFSFLYKKTYRTHILGAQAKSDIVTLQYKYKVASIIIYRASNPYKRAQFLVLYYTSKFLYWTGASIGVLESYYV